MAKTVKYGAIAGLVLYLIAVIVLCTMRTDSLPQVEITWLGIPIDKIAHFSFFLPYPILTWLALHTPGRSTGKRIFVASAIFITGVLVAAGTEVLQTFTEYREGELLDFAADCGGLSTGMIIVSIIAYFVQRRKK